MPVYHIVLHAFGTWHPDHPDGWHQHGESQPLRPQPLLGQHRKRLQRWPPIPFSSEIQQDFLAMALDICARRKWRCHALAINSTHIHLIPSWRDQLKPIQVQSTFKRLLAWRCAKLQKIPGRRWFSDGGLPKRVEDEQHLQHLINHYLPEQGGVFWKEGQPIPPLRAL